jgi:hypothetical protein
MHAAPESNKIHADKSTFFIEPSLDRWTQVKAFAAAWQSVNASRTSRNGKWIWPVAVAVPARKTFERTKQECKEGHSLVGT